VEKPSLRILSFPRPLVPAAAGVVDAFLYAEEIAAERRRYRLRLAAELSA
jgi:hypothetical protein